MFYRLDDFTWNYPYIIYLLDIDECTDEELPCALNAYCENTVGAFKCYCKEGYTAEGNKCNGKYLLTEFHNYFNFRKTLEFEKKTNASAGIENLQEFFFVRAGIK